MGFKENCRKFLLKLFSMVLRTACFRMDYLDFITWVCRWNHRSQYIITHTIK